LTMPFRSLSKIVRVRRGWSWISLPRRDVSA